MKWNITARKAVEAFLFALASMVSTLSSADHAALEPKQVVNGLLIAAAMGAFRGTMNAAKHIDDGARGIE